jgi:hypothetical protein
LERIKAHLLPFAILLAIEFVSAAPDGVAGSPPSADNVSI